MSTICYLRSYTMCPNSVHFRQLPIKITARKFHGSFVTSIKKPELECSFFTICHAASDIPTCQQLSTRLPCPLTRSKFQQLPRGNLILRNLIFKSNLPAASGCKQQIVRAIELIILHLSRHWLARSDYPNGTKTRYTKWHPFKTRNIQP